MHTSSLIRINGDPNQIQSLPEYKEVPTTGPTSGLTEIKAFVLNHIFLLNAQM